MVLAVDGPSRVASNSALSARHKTYLSSHDAFKVASITSLPLRLLPDSTYHNKHNYHLATTLTDHSIMSSSTILTKPPKALTFDVFGTVVNWRKTVVATLIATSSTKPSTGHLKPEDWARFAQQWRDSYGRFTRSFNPATDEWRDIDTHHRLSLISLLEDWGLQDVYDEAEVEKLSKVWHWLEPWEDSSRGLEMLGSKFVTSTLSNGNQELLRDLDESGGLHFRRIISGADFGAYKPHPRVYLGAAEKLGVDVGGQAEEGKGEVRGEVAMVAAHLSDLQAASKLGFRTVYVEREGEEAWEKGGKDWTEAREWVDLWVGIGEGGFVEVARRFGIEE